MIMEKKKDNWSVCDKIIKAFFSFVNANWYGETTYLAAV